MRVCKVCGDTKNESEFRNEEKTCKKCNNKKDVERKRILSEQKLANHESIKCPKCGKIKASSEFSVGQSMCKTCFKAYHTKNIDHEHALNKENYNKNRDKVLARAKERSKGNTHDKSM